MEMARRAGIEADVTITADQENPVARVFEETNGLGADIVIVSAPAAAAQELAVEIAARRGQISLFASLPPNSPPVALDTNTIHYREISVFGGFSSVLADCLLARDLVANRMVTLAPIITHHFPLAEIEQAIKTFKAGETLKAVIHPPQS